MCSGIIACAWPWFSCLFFDRLWTPICRPSRNLIDLIPVALERYKCLVSSSFYFLKIGQWIKKVMDPKSKLMHLTLFSWYLNYFNSDFVPLAVILNVIQYSSQWPLIYLIKQSDQNSTLGLHKKSTQCEIWSKLIKSSNNLGFDIKAWKILFWWSFDQSWPSANSRLTTSILDILT